MRLNLIILDPLFNTKLDKGYKTLFDKDTQQKIIHTSMAIAHVFKSINHDEENILHQLEHLLNSISH